MSVMKSAITVLAVSLKSFKYVVQDQCYTVAGRQKEKKLPLGVRLSRGTLDLNNRDSRLDCSICLLHHTLEYEINIISVVISTG